VNLATLLEEQATLRPEQPAVVDAHSQLSYGQLAREVREAAAGLSDAGLVPGDRVVVLVSMSPALYAVVLAVLRAGLVATFVDPGCGRRRLAELCSALQPRAIVCSAKARWLRWALAPLRRIPLAFTIGARLGRAWPPRGDGTRPAVAVDAAQPAIITATSGSTGQPKIAARSHGLLLAQHRALAQSLQHQPGSCELATLPVFALGNLASGMTVLIPDCDLRRPGRIDPRPVLAQIRRHRPRSAVASPAFFECLLTAERGELDLLAAIHTGGAPVFPSLQARLQTAAPQAEVVAVYGSTEAEPIAEQSWSAVGADDRAAMCAGRGLLAGHPVAAIDLRILHDRFGQPREALDATAFAAETCAVDEVGEIVVAGEHVLPGYRDGVGDAETKFRVEGRIWHRSGDAGSLDAQGRLWLLGRCGSAVPGPAGMLYPFAVEAAAMAVPGLRRAALAWHHERPVLVYEAAGAGDPAAALRAELAWAGIAAWYRHPVPLDRRHNAKVDYPALQRLLDKIDIVR
jgi:acyl-CoA synthetase (AMP-forming)/AMP-acid ligase II